MVVIHKYDLSQHQYDELFRRLSPQLVKIIRECKHILDETKKLEYEEIEMLSSIEGWFHSHSNKEYRVFAELIRIIKDMHGHWKEFEPRYTYFMILARNPERLRRNNERIAFKNFISDSLLYLSRLENLKEKEILAKLRREDATLMQICRDPNVPEGFLEELAATGHALRMYERHWKYIKKSRKLFELLRRVLFKACAGSPKLQENADLVF